MNAPLRANALTILVCALAGCSHHLGDPGDGEGAGKPLAGPAPTFGLVTGGIYEAGKQPLSEYGDEFFCEMKQLGTEWIRIEAEWVGTSPQTYRDIVRKAHAHGIRVVVVVTASTCPAEGGVYLGVGPFDDTDSEAIDRFTERYVEKLERIATEVFTGDATPDAWEITNEPDIHFNPDYVEYDPAYGEHGCIGHSRIDGNTFAWLLRRVHEWRERTGRDERLISGGILDVPDDPWGHPWFGAVLRSGAWTAGPPPVDYWGVHPYKAHSYDNGCINDGRLDCFEPWAASVRDSLAAVREAVTEAAGAPRPLFATEWGWERIGPKRDRCARASMCVLREEQRVEAMRRGAQAMASLVDVALWYDYRDYHLASGGVRGMGLRGLYDEARALHPAHEPVWRAFAELAGGPGGPPDSCWSDETGAEPEPGAPHALVFDEGDARRSSAGGDWRWGHYKAQCGVGEAVGGLSASGTTGQARAVLCRPMGTAGSWSQDTCETRIFSAADARGTTATGDWDWLHYKGECAEGAYVAGVAQTTSGELDSILCCRAPVEHRDCEPRILGAAEDAPGEAWDPGSIAVECGEERYVAGISRRTDDGRPHAILCCRP